MTDIETRRAVDALAWRIRHRGDDDPDVLAAEFVTLLKARGWRHIPSLSSVPDDLRQLPAPPSDDYRQARQRLPRRTEETNHG